MRGIIQIGLFILIYVCGAFETEQWILITLTLIFIALNSYLHFKDKRELSQATFYIRPGMQRSLKELVKAILMLGFIISGVYLLIKLLPEEQINKASSFYFAIALLSFFWGNYYQTFKSSLRAFDFGIIIPKSSETKINWNSINNLEIDGNKLILEYSENEKYIFGFDKRDLDDALKIKKQFLSSSR